ncbi:MAG: MCE family protein [Verrucomicrobiaceae bacterium]|nr:MCE family protein [Verrucomicrobiaceae bacterium]
MNESNRKTEMLVGLFILVGLLLLGALVLQFSKVKEAFRDTYELSVSFSNATGITKGAPVVLGGSKIGKVEDKMLKPDASGVVLKLKLYGDVDVPVGSVFSVGTSGLMGDGLINIKVPESEGPITKFYAHDFAETIEGDKSDDLSTLQNAATSAAKKVDMAMNQVRDALEDVKSAMKKVNEGALSDETVASFKSSMTHLESTMKNVDEKMVTDANAQNLHAAIADIREAAAAFKGAAKATEEQVKRLGLMFDKLDPAIEKVDGVMVRADDALKALKDGAESFSRTAKTMNSGAGLLPALLNDPELKETFKDLIENLKRKGFIFYRDAAGKEEESSPSQRGGLFNRPGR